MLEAQYKKIQYIVNYHTCFDETKQNAIIIFLAGAGSRGENIGVLRTNPYFVETKKLFWMQLRLHPNAMQIHGLKFLNN